MKNSEILRKAKALIDTPEKWCQETYAANAYGASVEIRNPAACSFCSTGALIKVLGGYWDSYKYPVYFGMTPKQLFDFNDSHAHAEVMALWDKAIERAEREEKCAT